MATKIKTINLSRVKTLTLGRHSSKPITPRLRGRAGQERNRRLMMRDPLCVQCKREGIIKRWDVQDHKIPLTDGGPDTDANLQGLCKKHHDEKTAREARARHV